MVHEAEVSDVSSRTTLRLSSLAAFFASWDRGGTRRRRAETTAGGKEAAVEVDGKAKVDGHGEEDMTTLGLNKNK
jgi:hypothetical protein